MTLKIVGIERQDYDFDGVKFNGYKLHGIKLNEPRSGLTGDVVMSIKIPDGHKCAGVGIEVGKTYTVYFDDKKHVDLIAECKS